ncbi:MAG: PQQ-binding-like beta-propeller repeat protein [Planctomycetaceae bacterium]|nr:PQQ-binding-like beta-propeller repeat protein [Planctomycetaceae bacterium]
MSSTSPVTDAEPVSKTKAPKFPLVMSVLTVLYITAAVLAQVFISEIEDASHMGLDIVMVLSIVGAGLLFLMWLVWICLLSRWKISTRIGASILLFVLPLLFFKIFRPVHGGDTNLVRFEPIWKQREIPLETTVPTVAEIDLKVESVDDFPRFLGPNQNGIVTSGMKIDADHFVDGARLLWKQPIGAGWAAFSARNGYAVTMEQRGEQECVTCYAVETGQLQWVYSHAARHKDKINLGRVGPRSTPTIHDGRVYSMGAVGNLACLDGKDGSVIWQVDLNEILGITLEHVQDSDGFDTQFESNAKLSWGRSASPLVVGESIVVAGGGPKESRATLLAFDLRTGELRWKGGDEMIAYGSPVLATLCGRQQILLTAETKAMGFDAETGSVLWQYARPGESDGAANTSQLSVVSDTDVLTTKGYPDGGGERIHLEIVDGQFVPSSVWSSSRVLKTKLTSPVVHEGYAYSLSNGFMECSRLSDGNQMWKRRGRFGHGQVLLVDKNILLHSESGELFLLEASPDAYLELGSIRTIEGVCWNTLCLTGNKLLVRSEIEAACIELPMITGDAL